MKVAGTYNKNRLYKRQPKILLNKPILKKLNWPQWKGILAGKFKGRTNQMLINTKVVVVDDDGRVYFLQKCVVRVFLYCAF